MFMYLFARFYTRQMAYVVLAVAAALAFVALSTLPTRAGQAKSGQITKIPPGGGPPIVVLDAKSYLQGFVDFCNQSKPGYMPNSVGVVMVSNRPDANQDATYTEGTLAVVKGTKQLQTMSGGKMTDTRYFNNQRWNIPPVGGDLSIPVYPFDPKHTDQPLLTLDAATGKATLPGGVSITLTYSNAVLYGQTSNGEMFVITLKKVAGQKIPG
jgi:hypothetical protein